MTFAYVPGPQGKTAAENRYWAALGAQVNSMTFAPEVVLANELEIPSAGLVVGHKRSSADPSADPEAEGAIGDSLARSRDAMARIVRAFLAEAGPVPFGNFVYRFGDEAGDRATR